MFEENIIVQMYKRRSLLWLKCGFIFTRCHPSICSFPSKHFYNGELKTAEGIGTSHKPLKMWPKTNVEYTHYPHVFCHVDGVDKALTVKTEAGNEQSRCNQLEAEQVLKVLRYMVEVENVDPKHINIMSQYNAQCSAITEALISSGMLDFTVSTVVASQGGEWEYVIFSLVRSLPDYLIQEQPTKGWCLQHLGFITDENQINVALTRAKKGIVIIGNRHLLNCDPVWKELLHDYDRKGCVFLAENFPPCENNVTVLYKRES